MGLFASETAAALFPSMNLTAVSVGLSKSKGKTRKHRIKSSSSFSLLTQKCDVVSLGFLEPSIS